MWSYFDTYVTKAENYRDRLMVIMAGYEEEMEELLLHEHICENLREVEVFGKGIVEGAYINERLFGRCGE